MPIPHDQSAPAESGATGPARFRPQLISLVIALVLVAAWVAWACLEMRRWASGLKSSRHMQQIGLAIHNYHHWNGELPRSTHGPDGRPLLSWRVHLLPYLGHDALYREFKLDEPWDSPANERLLDRMPEVYARPDAARDSPGRQTHYRGFSSPGAVFERRPPSYPWRLLPPVGGLTGPLAHPAADPRPGRFTVLSVKDGTQNTIFVVEAGEPVEWTRPIDLDGSAGQPFPSLGGFGIRDTFGALMGDGSTRRFRLDTPEDRLRALVTHSGGEPVTPD